MKEDIYITMLRFGREKLIHGFTVDNLVEHLNQSGFNNISIHSIILYHYFYKIFFGKDEEIQYPPHSGIIFYLRPECYMQLLEYDNMLAARKESRTASILAIGAIILSVISILIAIIK